jgi:hypothetical protein
MAGVEVGMKQTSGESGLIALLGITWTGLFTKGKTFHAAPLILLDYQPVSNGWESKNRPSAYINYPPITTCTLTAASSTGR